MRDTVGKRLHRERKLAIYHRQPLICRYLELESRLEPNDDWSPPPGLLSLLPEAAFVSELEKLITAVSLVLVKPRPVSVKLLELVEVSEFAACNVPTMEPPTMITSLIVVVG